MPTDITDASIATACVYCMMLARSGALDTFDGLTALSRATALGCATVIISAMACTLTVAISLLLPALDATRQPLLQPFAAMALVAVLLTTINTITRSAHQPLHILLQQLRPWLLPACALTSAASLMISPAQNLLHAALGAVIYSFAFSLLLQLCVYISAAMAAIPRACSLQKNSLHKNSLQEILLQNNAPYFHALTLAVAAVLAFIGSVAARYW